VRYLGNSSSGRMGLEIARAAAVRGAEVTVVAANISEPVPSNVCLVQVETTSDLDEAMRRFADSDVLVMAAAPADFRAQAPSPTKIKKSGDGGLSLSLVQTPDVLAGLAATKRPGQIVVGFAAETAQDEAELAALASAKMARKGCDLLVANNVSGGAIFGAEATEVLLFTRGRMLNRVSAAKSTAAHHIIDAIVEIADWGGTR
jgi:phosphopantothenoylcysteine decarboxylase / phosphopantothenate---cysteine ligase